jgi:hypothetical protein
MRWKLSTNQMALSLPEPWHEDPRAANAPAIHRQIGCRVLQNIRTLLPCSMEHIDENHDFTIDLLQGILKTVYRLVIIVKSSGFFDA